MRKHLLTISDIEFENIISGKERFLVRFFKKKFDFLSLLGLGDLVFVKKKRGEILAQFNVGKIVLVEEFEETDFEIAKRFIKDFKKVEFDNLARENRTLVIVQIDKLEQFITSPIDVPARIRKEWVVL